MALEILTLSVTPIAQNCRLLFDAGSKDCVVVDPGGDVELIDTAIKERGLKPEAIWLTHSHYDHCGGVHDLKELYPVPLYAHKAEQEMRSLVALAAERFGMDYSGGIKNCPEPEHYIEEGDVLEIASHQFQVYFTPGHSPGHVVFYQSDQSILIAGDTLFEGSIGRTDLPGGDFKLLINSIRNKIFTLPDDTQVLPGHGGDTSIGIEKTTNPFLQDI